MKLAVGIPFRASKRDAALRLCLHSLKRYVETDFDLFLLLDVTAASPGDEFDLEPIRRLFPEVRIREFRAVRCGSHKQVLIDWICGHGNGYDRALILHSDVFLYRAGLVELMLRRLDESGGVSCHWSIPLYEVACGAVALDGAPVKCLSAPRIATWLFCLDCRRLTALRKRHPLRKKYFDGLYWQRLDGRDSQFVRWIRSQPGFERYAGRYARVFCDIGCFFRFVVDMTGQRVVVMGETEHPELTRRELVWRPEGYVHVEQFNPERFATPAGGNAFFAGREAMLLDLLRREYGEE